MKDVRIEKISDMAAALAFITAEQRDPARATHDLGTDPDRVARALASTGQWPDNLRVVREHGRVVGAVLTETRPREHRVVVHGPWATDEAWPRVARPLLDAALAGLAEGTDVELSADLANERLASLAIEAGFSPGEPTHEYTVTRAIARDWTEGTDTTRARRATASDLDLVHDLHDSEFPATYATAAHLVEDPALFTVVVERAGTPIGYASGHVEADGSGHLDFMAVDPSARGVGDGHVLLAAVVREIFAEATLDELRLAVEARRTPAITFYSSRGFVRSATFRPYRRP